MNKIKNKISLNVECFKKNMTIYHVPTCTSTNCCDTGLLNEQTNKYINSTMTKSTIPCHTESWMYHRALTVIHPYTE